MAETQYTGLRTPEALRVGEQVLKVVVDHAMFRQIRDASLDLIHTMRTLKMPGGILVQADPGMGKTLLLQLIQREITLQPSSDGGNACLHVALDNAVDAHGMAAAMTLALGYPALPCRAQLTAMNRMTQLGLERVRPWVLLIDEMQHVCEGNKDITARSVTDWLKVRMDAHNFPVICMGTRSIERLALINPQFTSRASANFVIPAFQFDDAWRQLLAGFAGAVKGVDLNVINGAACRPLHQACAGNIRMLKRILTYACMHAATQVNRIVDLAALSKGFVDAAGQAADQVNPFIRAAR